MVGPVLLITKRLLASLVWVWGGFSAAAFSQVWHEDFDGPFSSIGDRIVDHPLISLVESAGVGGTNAIRVAYEGSVQGSKRVLVRNALPPSLAYTLSFSVNFCEEFDFAKGGKLHGLGPKKGVAGGNALTPLGWSARLMFRRGGGLKTYIYHQGMRGKYGDVKVAENFRFSPGRFHKVDMRVVLNSPPSESNGRVQVRVDGQEVIDHAGLRFRSEEGEDGLIQNLLFSTFHGGNSPGWAPRTADGEFKTDCAYFDEWSITH